LESGIIADIMASGAPTDMKGDFLYDIVDFILNHANENELEVMRAALKRRVEGGEGGEIAAMNPSRIARQTAASIRKQVDISLERVRGMVWDFVREIVQKEAPELDEAQIQQMLGAILPGGAPSGGASEGPQRPAEPHPTAPMTGGDRALPPEALATMIMQFVSYSTQSMGISEQLRLNDEIPNWHEKYWKRFSPRQRHLISVFLKGELDEEDFWRRIKTEIGLEPDSAIRE
jgi:hypothetical protein